MLDPLTVLREAIRAVPAVKYALGVGGILAVIAIIKGFGLDARATALGTLSIVVLMVALVLFAQMSGRGAKRRSAPAVVLTWFCLLMFMAVSVALFTSVFFDAPLKMSKVIIDDGVTVPKRSSRLCRPLRAADCANSVSSGGVNLRKQKPSAGLQSAKIGLSTRYKSGASPLTLVHEFAHHAVDSWDTGMHLYPHGPEFVGVYGDCLAMSGLVPYEGFRAMCNQFRVQFLDTRLAGSVAALRKLVKKRAAEAAQVAHPPKGIIRLSASAR